MGDKTIRNMLTYYENPNSMTFPFSLVVPSVVSPSLGHFNVIY